ncbi:zinc finger Y-chromosomal protein-like [Leuresthes tenuis]|uniref:zinc finger Y-chromosomal protein-like n=1 Tax=Leuresthes tenuis TaxID=355514 RepID=UPI003B506259
MEAPAGGQVCALLLREEARSREVGCQWESPEEEEEARKEEARKEVGCQSDGAETKDAGVQVDLLTQQLSWRHSGSSAMLLQCLTVRPDGPDGGTLLQHCTTNRTRTRTVRPPVKPSTEPTRSRTRGRKRLPPQSFNIARRSQRSRRRKPPDPREEEEAPEEEEEVTVEDDTGDPNWTPSEGGVAPPPAPEDSQHALLRVVKLEPDSTVCDVCGKVMKNKSSLARHSFIHTGKKPFACHLCELRFNRRDNLQHHLNRLHPNGVAKLEKQRVAPAWLCAVCGKTFSCRSRLKTHEVIHSGVKPHRCDLCPKAYMRTNDLEHHKKVVHVDGAAEPPRPTSLLCDLCGKEFKCRSQLAIHFQTHTGERPHLCDICGRKFARQYQLKRHKILVHANHISSEENQPPDTPFTCSVCGKRLKSEALLAAHARIHTGDKPHRCGVCLRSFQRAACLRQHHARVHLKARASEELHAASRRRNAATVNAFPCAVCSRVFRFRSLLASHALIHSEVRPFPCDFCSRRFRRLSHLKRHREVVHANGARPPESFVCHVCGKDKKCRSQLARHVIIHTGERPYACDLCPARFNRHGNLQQHKKRMHGVGQLAADEDPPLLFDDDLPDVLAYKQEETVVAVDVAGESLEAAPSEDMDVMEQLDAT